MSAGQRPESLGYQSSNSRLSADRHYQAIGAECRQNAAIGDWIGRRHRLLCQDGDLELDSLRDGYRQQFEQFVGSFKIKELHCWFPTSLRFLTV